MNVRGRVLVAAMLVGLVAMAAPARADVIFDLDCTLSGSVCTPGGPFGSVSLVDNGNTVDVTAELFNQSLDVYVISLNWNTLLGGAVPGNLVASGGNIGSASISAGQDAAGYNGWFDIRVEDLSGQLNPLMFTLSRTSFDLNAEMFRTRDENGLYFAVVRTLGGDVSSTYYGSTSAVPEPASLLLLGTGLAFAARAARKRR